MQKRPWSIIMIVLALLIAGAACAEPVLEELAEEPIEERESVQFTTVECWSLNPGGDVSVSLLYPTVMESGKRTSIQISISNESDIAWDGVRVSLDSAVPPTGDNYFYGFALDDSRPLPTETWVRNDGVLAWVKWTSTSIAPGAETSLDLGLRAVRPGGYGTRIAVILDRGRDHCSVREIIYTTIKE